MVRLAVLGSTGSIGRATLDVVRRFPERLRVVGLAAGRNRELLRRQILEFRPRRASLAEPEAARQLRAELGLEVGWGEAGAVAVATLEEAEVVVVAMGGSAGLRPAFEAARCGKRLAMANKEALVMAGHLLMSEARRAGARIVPLDSEHHALGELLRRGGRRDLRRVILTASGGPFWDWPAEALGRVTPQEALRHPRWRMGRKITVDSASMMNKALEVVEARWLFGLSPEAIEVCVHPEAVVHALAQYADGSMLAQLAVPDMRLPIAHALLGRRRDLSLPPLSLQELGSLRFFPPDRERFPALELGYRALREAESMGVVLSVADEVAVEAFLQGRIPFTHIPRLVERVMEEHRPFRPASLEEVREVERWARRRAEELT